MSLVNVDDDSRAQYLALTKATGLVGWGDRSLVEVGGADRARFLHNLCTNEIRKLAPGAGCEAFLTNVQGKILAHVLVFSGPETLVLETVAGQGEVIRAHLDRYLIREQVTLVDRSSDWSGWLLAGPQAADLLSNTAEGEVPAAHLGSSPGRLAGCEVWIRRVGFVGPTSILLHCRRSDAAAVGQALAQAGARRVGAPAWDVCRIEAGFPFFGRDISEQNLPQEVDRDRQAISFTKGCYLGQETVARIDALGHVNRTLVGLRLTGGEIPAPGSPLSAAGAAVGSITSAGFSPRFETAVALGYVRRGSNEPGTQLESVCGPAVVTRLPLVET